MLNYPEYDYKYGDFRYYYKIHCARQKEQGYEPLGYDSFIKRLKKMSLRDAIYEPRLAPPPSKWESKTPIQDSIRRTVTLNNENVQILGLNHLEMVEKVFKNKKKSKTQMPKPKKSLRDRFISLFK